MEMNRHELICELRKLIASIEDGMEPGDVGCKMEDLLEEVYDTEDSGEEF